MSDVQRVKRRLSRRLTVRLWFGWFFEPKKKYRIHTAMTFVVVLMAVVASHLLLSTTGTSRAFQLGAGLLVDVVVIMVAWIWVELLQDGTY